METLLGEVSELSNQNSNLLHRLKKWKGLFVRSKLVKSSQSSYFGHGLRNKHCAILVSCSDKERNCIQAHETSCKFMEFHVSSGNCMQAYVTFAFWNILQAFWNILEHTACILEHSGTYCMYSGTFWNILYAFWNILHTFWNILHTFWNILHAFWNILYAFWNILEHSGTFWNLLEPSGTFWNHSNTNCPHTDTQTHGHGH